MGTGFAGLLADAAGAIGMVRGTIDMLKLILGLLASLPTLEKDVEGVVNEIKDAPDGGSLIRNSVTALRKLADDIEAAIS